MPYAPKFAAAGLFLGLSAGLAQGCAIRDPFHCHVTQDPCGADMVCNSCVGENNGCTPVASMGDYDDSCFKDGVGDDGDETDSDEDSDVAEDSGSGEETESGESPETGSEEGGETGSESETGDESGSESESESGGGSEEGTGSESGEDSGTDEGGSETDDGSESGTEGGSESGSDSGSTEPECTEDEACVAPTPYCENQVCVDCTGLMSETCGNKNPETPACRDDGVCVECTGPEHCGEATAPICEANECRGCQEHDECDVACNLSTGACIDEEALHVDNVACVGGSEDGTVGNPFCTIGEGVGAIPGTGPGVVIVHGTATLYSERAEVNGNKVVVLLGEGAPEVRANNQEVLYVHTGGRVFARGLQLGGGNTSSGVNCNGGTVWLDDSEVSGTTADGVNAQNCEIHLRRTTVSNSSGGDGVRATGGTVTLRDVTVSGSDGSGINMVSGGTLSLEEARLTGNGAWGLTTNGASVTGTRVEVLGNASGGVNLTNSSDLTLDTSIIGRNGDNAATTRGLQVASSSADLNYVTIAANQGDDGGRSVNCSGGSTVAVRNSIIVAEIVLETVTCPDITVTTSAVQDMDILGGNRDMGAWEGTWFLDVLNHDFHLGTTGSDFSEAGLWKSGDPSTDIDGQARPSMNDAPDWPGADVPD